MVLHCVSLQAYIRELKELLMSVSEDSVMVRIVGEVGRGGREVGRGVAAHVCPRGLSHGTYN